MQHTLNRTMPTAARGFSLLELTLVLVIIGLLMGVATVSLVGGAERAKVTTTKASMNTIKSQLNSYYAEKSRLPETLQVLVADGYLAAGDLSDGWDRPLFYQPLADGSGTFDLISAGKDGEFDTIEDNIDANDLDAE
ncbi:MAG: type II secretion system protein GspG [Planctomycetota bacterium]